MTVEPLYLQPISPRSIELLLEHWKARHHDCVFLVFLPEAESHQIPAIQRIFREGEVPLMGAIFPALVTSSGFRQEGGIFMGFPQQPPWFIAESQNGDAAEMAKAIADNAIAAMENSVASDAQLFLIFDGMLHSIGSALVQLFGYLRHQCTYTGVCAGSESFEPKPCLFDQHRLFSNGVLGMVLDSNLKIAVQHGYPVSKSLMRATSTYGNRIEKIDGIPAMSAYQQLMACEFGIELTHENFYEYAVHYPFGLVESLEILVRIPVNFGGDGSIHCVGEVPPNSMLRLLRAPTLEQSTCVSSLVEMLHSPKNVPLIVFYCAGRRMHFGDQAQLELQRLQAQSQASVVFGALSLGEIGTDPEFGIPVFHNAALVCWGSHNNPMATAKSKLDSLPSL
jgi:hypothetical protein